MIISKDNFVTDNMTNTVCYSSLLPKESSGLDPTLLGLWRRLAAVAPI